MQTMAWSASSQVILICSPLACISSFTGLCSTSSIILCSISFSGVCLPPICQCRGFPHQVVGGFLLLQAELTCVVVVCSRMQPLLDCCLSSQSCFGHNTDWTVAILSPESSDLFDLRGLVYYRPQRRQLRQHRSTSSASTSSTSLSTSLTTCVIQSCSRLPWVDIHPPQRLPRTFCVSDAN
jgi:hypothetical protein